jgi:hypothetical protein
MTTTLDRVARALELLGDQLLLAPAAVLRQLPSRFQPSDGDLEVHDALEHSLDVLRPQRVELRQPLRVQGGHQAALGSMLLRGFFYHPRYSISMHRRVVPGRHALALLVPAWRDVGVRAGEHHQHLVVEEFLPLRVGLRHVHVQHHVLALFVDHHGKVGGMKRAAGSGDQHGEAVGAHEL